MSRFLTKESLALQLLLAAFVALGPLSTDMYLPALPSMVGAFGVEISQVQLTLSVYLAGFSVFHLLCGPLSDRFGRKPILLGGMLVFLLACLGCAQATTVQQLLFWRFVQGIGACVGPTLARAMVRDIYTPIKVPKVLATLNAIMALAPIVAPIMGGWMLLIWPWPSIFLFLAAYSVLAILMLMTKMPESLAQPQSVRFSNIMKNYLLLIKTPRFRVCVLAASFLYAGAFAFVSSSSFILMDFMQVPGSQFGYWFTFIVVGYMVGSIFTARYSHRFAARTLMKGGALIAVIASVIMLMLCLFHIYHPFSIVLPIALYTCGVGVTLPQAMAIAMEPFPEMAGTASALMGFIQMAAASAAAAIISVFLTGEPTPLALTLVACGGFSLIIFYCMKEPVSD